MTGRRRRVAPDGSALATRVASVSATPPPDWDSLTVAPPGGHVLQGRAWAEHRREQGWRPHFVRFTDGRAALVLTIAQRPFPGFLAYAPRGPIAAGDPPGAVAARARALADWGQRHGARVLVVDPQLDASPSYDEALAGRGFRETEETQAARHRMILRFPSGASRDDVFRSIAKTTRQRIRAAERAGTIATEDRVGEHFEAFGRLLDATAQRREFYYGNMKATARWWRRVTDDGHARLWVATHEDRLLGGLFVYLQGGIHATAYSGDDAALRREYPGTMHLLRWTAIAAALDSGAPAIDLGGVDVPGARHRPRPADTLWGLYEHKRSYGAEWVESAAAHRIVIRPWLEGVTGVVRSMFRVVARRRGFPGSRATGRSQ